MLPSTGYFKGLNCPFYDSGFCERPYCHFRHVKKEPQNNDAVESGTILQKLVSAAVQKVLQQTEASPPKPIKSNEDISNSNNVQAVPSKAIYNPTPISELNKINNGDSENNEEINEQRKRHIPVPYTPRKPTNLAIKRPIEANGSFKPFIYIPPPVKYTPGCTDNAQLDPYMPKGSVESKEKYLPGKETEMQEYTPNETQTSTKRNYVPSDKSANKNKILEYKPTKVTVQSESTKVTYQPTPRSLAPCFSSDEEEEPSEKKSKLSNDLNGLDDLGPEFDILDQILDEEKIDIEKNKKVKKNENTSGSKVDKENSKKNDSKRDKEKSKRERSKHDKNKSQSEEKSTNHDKQSRDKKSSSRDSEKKSSQKSSSKDKDKSDSKKHSHSKSSKHTSSSSKSDSNSKQSKYSKEDSKRKSSSHKEHHKSHKSSKHTKEKHKEKKKDKDESNLDSFDEQLIEMSESDEETIALECKKIFEEYVPIEKPKFEQSVNKHEDEQESDEYVPAKKRISRTVDKNITVTPRQQVKPNFKVNAAQTMADRLAKIREFHASKSQSVSTEVAVGTQPEVPKSIFSTSVNSNSKIRIAHVPYASTLVNAKKTISHTIDNNNKSAPSTSSTAIQTVKKGAQRVAHMPNEKFIDRPGVLEPLASKIPANIRSIYLNMMIDECLKIYLSPTDAYARAQHEELSTSKKCSTNQIYKNSAVLTVSRLRKELQECNGVKKSGSDCKTLQKVPQAISGTTSSAGSWSIESKHRKSMIDSVNFVGEKLYNNIKKWILTEEQLHENGFPRVHSSGEKGRATIYGQKKQNPPKGYIRTCCRCNKEYTVDKKGFPSIKEECIYHPNRKYRVRGEVRYQCCSQDGMSDGCCIASCHVYEYVDYENLKGYIRTMHPEIEKNDYGVYSLDCEMCYTTHGLDLTRVTVIDSTCKVVYETLVKPFHPIIDYNTRYSGITEEQMMGVKTTLLDVQATLLTMFNNKTILVGHSLESDFKALKLIHDTVIDTSVLFPHKMGPPYKRALRNLSSEHLKKIIQNSVDGHDSAEDATVCMELLIYKLKEDLKTR